MTVIDDTAAIHALSTPHYVTLDFTGCKHSIRQRVLPYIGSAELGDEATCPVCIEAGRTKRKATGPVRETRGEGHALRDLRCPYVGGSGLRCNSPFMQRSHTGWCRFYESSWDASQDWTQLPSSGQLPL